RILRGPQDQAEKIVNEEGARRVQGHSKPPEPAEDAPRAAPRPHPCGLHALRAQLHERQQGRRPLPLVKSLRDGVKTPLFGSADILNACNLKCVHCYWWTTREPTAGELSPEQ